MKPYSVRLIVAASAIIAALVFSFAAIDRAPSSAQRKAGPKSGNTPTRTAAMGVNIQKNDHLGAQNVLKSVKVDFDKMLKDATGKMRHIQISKVEYLKSPGIRYYATVDGEARNIAYLDLKAAKVRLVNVEGTKPAHNLYQVLSASENADSYWSQRVLLAETIYIGNIKREISFSLPRKLTDELSLALLSIDPLHVASVEPGKLFPSSGSDNGGIRPNDPIRPPDWGNIFPPIEVLFHCKINSKNLKKCDEGCDMQSQAEDVTAWGSLGVSARKLCKDQSGCLWCAGVCCKSSSCSSETNPEPIFDCTLQGSS